MCGDGKRLDPCGISRPSWHVNFGSGDRGSDAAMNIAFEKTHRFLPRRVIAKGDVYVAVDQARHCCSAIGVDNYVGPGDAISIAFADERNAAIFANDRVAAAQTAAANRRSPSFRY